MKNNKLKIGALIVTYNPSKQIYKLLEYFIEKNIQVIIIDNTILETEVIKNINFNLNIKLIKNEKNYGIAKSLNKGVKLLDKEIEWFFTFDQDSIPQKNFLENFLKYLNYKKDIGILVPTILDKNINFITNKNLKKEIEEVDMAIQSGMLINKEAYLKTNGFNESLIIYYVDNEFVHEVKKNNYKIFRIKNAILEHSDGKLQRKKILGKSLYFNERSNLAIYFRSRNLLYMCYKYNFWYLKDLVYDTITNLLFAKNKKAFFYYTIKGLKDSNKKIEFINDDIFKRN
ncbi:glycosyltransferase [uncultured Fusobacterium sp.]|uniref:glycosyltransferase n=1 Tax=uncultured Fusobacterium sp. TaxID=159267 RepID=UPI0026604C91|nr:glycosyltransferase [uncultured Fusobacterium sp.]